ncbi:hypothetical protein QBC41DRAFT_312504 [Cercophora samala]|uniref:Uncharacterized protein n=1 Tax=Cercophora samala TaxID=330535 RepID=A0AA39ZL08_9PEZI|nr:hypothetical protein QBC41DRAFT_312504 [Cercophora samala]
MYSLSLEALASDVGLGTRYEGDQCETTAKAARNEKKKKKLLQNLRSPRGGHTREQLRVTSIFWLLCPLKSAGAGLPFILSPFSTGQYRRAGQSVQDMIITPHMERTREQRYGKIRTARHTSLIPSRPFPSIDHPTGRIRGHDEQRPGSPRRTICIQQFGTATSSRSPTEGRSSIGGGGARSPSQHRSGAGSTARLVQSLEIGDFQE